MKQIIKIFSLTMFFCGWLLLLSETPEELTPFLVWKVIGGFSLLFGAWLYDKVEKTTK